MWPMVLLAVLVSMLRSETHIIYDVDYPTNSVPSCWPHNSAQQPGANRIQLAKGGESSPLGSPNKGTNQWSAYPQEDLESPRKASKPQVEGVWYCAQLPLFLYSP
jgi:hypothetical protein